MASSSSTRPAIPLDSAQSDTRNGSTLLPLAIPYPSIQSTAETKTYSAMYDRVIEAKRRAGEGTDDFYSDLDVLKHSPNGWPSIAATQMYMPNYDSHRAFKTPTHAVLINYEQKIECVANRLDELNFEDAEVDHGRALKSLPFDREKFIARCVQGPAHLSTAIPESSTDRMAERENLYTCLGILQREYFTLLHIHHQNLKFPRVSRRAHIAHYQAARDPDRQGLDNEACAFMRHIDDWICTQPDVIFQRFEALLYTKSRGLMQFLKHVCCLFCFDPPSTMSDDDPRVQYSLRGFERFFRGVLVLSSMSLLVIPVGILYLNTDWSRVAYLCVVVAFSSLFCVVMTLFEFNTARLLVGLAAYVAVLIAFLSNNVANYGAA
ncbi:hypothetical protein F4818DRAFT_440552 [Hypoxylon cercidicola]|nr:hypothetical protein F4818DRAFT_440552 [Hypoxylon cercidicola]